MGWKFNWVSSLNSDFNYDFNTSFTEEQQGSGSVDYNYRELRTVPDSESGANKFASMSGTDVLTYTREAPGMSAFVFSDGIVYHTYSAYSRGSMCYGECISGSTGHRRGETKRICGFAGTMSTLQVLTNGRHVKTNYFGNNNQAFEITDMVTNLSYNSVVFRTKPS